VRIAPDEIQRRGSVPKNGSIFFTIFQTFMSGKDEDGDPAPNFGDYPPDFFDFIIIDECHRGGARDESTWRGILEYFSPAVQLGLTATPKRKDNADTYAYFGEPVFVYSLKEGINDGFLTPFRVVQISTTLDEYVHTPGDLVVNGDVEEGRLYTEKDFNRIIEIPQRERYRVEKFMEQMNQRRKTIVFCASQTHALKVRDFINQTKRNPNANYCHRVTADEGARGEQWLKDFQDNEKTLPTVLTTSQKLTTGVDARNVRNIVLMRPIESMIEFKQIIGRGTRLYDGKDYFTIYDFVKAHHLFLDPEWDGDPIAPEVCSKCGATPCTCPPPPPKLCKICSQPFCICPPEICDKCGQNPCVCVRKVEIKLPDGKVRAIQHMVSTSFWHPDGTPMSSQQFLESLFGKLPEFFKDEAELRQLWSAPDTRAQLLERLSEKGFGKTQLEEMQRIVAAEHSDLFDVLGHVAFALEPMTRQERADRAMALVGQHFMGKQKVFLDFVLSHYVAQGVEELEPTRLTALLKLKYGDSISDAVSDLGGDANAIRSAFTGFQRFLYEAAAA
jgi:type I restriction enzyme R subunit